MSRQGAREKISRRLGEGNGRQGGITAKSLKSGNFQVFRPTGAGGVIFFKKLYPPSWGSKNPAQSDRMQNGHQNGIIFIGKTNVFGSPRRPDLEGILFYAKNASSELGIRKIRFWDASLRIPWKFPDLSDFVPAPGMVIFREIRARPPPQQQPGTPRPAAAACLRWPISVCKSVCKIW